MKVLSLFDGMACGMLSMQAVGIEVDRYVAFEIDKYAVQTSSHNFPMIEHRGDVFDADFTEFRGFDFLVGGSPCTYWSIAQKNNRETEASGMGWELFSQYVRALREAQPMYFIYENNKSMANAIRESITETFGFEPICINSALVSAQNRQRLYWVGKRNPDGTYGKVHVDQPEDRGVLLRDVLDRNIRIPEYGNEDKARPVGASYSKNCGGWWHRIFSDNPNKQQVDMVVEPVGTTKDGKSYCLTAGYANGSGENIGNYAAHTLEKGCKSMVAEPVASTVLNVNPSGKGINGAVGRIDAKSRCLTTNKGEVQKIIVPVCVAQRGRYADTGKRSTKGQGKIDQFYEARQDGKTNALTTVQKDNNVCEPVRVGALPRPNGELSTSQAFRVYSQDGKSVNIVAGGGGAGGKTGLYAFEVPMYAQAIEWDENGKPTNAISGADGKTYTVFEVKDGQITIKGKQYPIKLADGFYIIRKLTVSECKRLQTVPEWYEFPVSDSQAYKMLGNGWTVEVIAHLINATKAEEVFANERD